MVYQHFTLVPNMTVAENLTISRAEIPPILDWTAERKRIGAFFETMPFRLDMDAMVTSLSAGEKQKVEILKQLFLGCRCLILDEPTSVLTPGEADELLDLLTRMTRANELSVLLITHKMREVVGYAQDVTVLRHGRVTGSGKIADITPAQLTEMMVGVQTLTATAARSGSAAREVRLRVEGLSAENDRGHRACEHLSFEVSAGEILGVAGVSGNGQKELVEVLAGQRVASAGKISINGAPYEARRAEMRKHRVFCLPEEPLRNGCVGRMSVAENLAFRTFDESPFARAGFIQSGPMRTAASELIDAYRIKTSSPDAPVETLSGGNIQRMILARELPPDAQVLIVANPCFGLDVRAIADIRAQIMAARNRGAAILLISEDLDELFELSDRLMVFFAGQIVASMPAAEADRAVIGRYMAGQ
jgi:simple sugar transport system ATP-binding protein